MKQVFEVYPYLGELYYKERQGEEVSAADVVEATTKKKDLLLG